MTDPTEGYATRTASGLYRRQVVASTQLRRQLGLPDHERQRRLDAEVARILDEVAHEWELLFSVPLPRRRSPRWWPGR